MFCLLAASASAQPDPASPTTSWVPVLYGMNSFPDPTGDQQTGSSESDIIGNLSQPSLFMQYISGYLGFRLRVGADMSPAGFKAAAFVGLDADLNGSLDLFLGVNNQGSKDQLGIWYTGTGLNTSPATTTIANKAVTNYAETVSNYGFMAVTSNNEPGAASLDLNGDGRTDQFLTFFIPIADITAAFAGKGISFNTNTIMQMVAATATQPNTLNQDLNGVNGSVNSSQSWAQLGAISEPYTSISVQPVPEPAVTTMLLSGSVAFVLLRRGGRARG